MWLDGGAYELPVLCFVSGFVTWAENPREHKMLVKEPESQQDWSPTRRRAPRDMESSLPILLLHASLLSPSVPSFSSCRRNSAGPWGQLANTLWTTRRCLVNHVIKRQMPRRAGTDVKPTCEREKILNLNHGKFKLDM